MASAFSYWAARPHTLASTVGSGNGPRLALRGRSEAAAFEGEVAAVSQGNSALVTRARSAPRARGTKKAGGLRRR